MFCDVLVRMTREGYSAFSRALSFAASSSDTSEETRPVFEGVGRGICVGGEFTGALRGGRLLSDPSAAGIGTADDVAGCNGGLEGEDVNASNWKRIDRH